MFILFIIIEALAICYLIIGFTIFLVGLIAELKSTYENYELSKSLTGKKHKWMNEIQSVFLENLKTGLLWPTIFFDKKGG